MVVGGGIAGLATAALLASRGHSVDLFEKNDELGGRVGSVERDGFRFDTGAVVVPDARGVRALLRAARHHRRGRARPDRLDPGYRVFFEGHDRPVDVRPDRARRPGALRVAGAGAGAARVDAYLASAEDTYDVALRRFLYSSFESRDVPATPTSCAGPPGSARC